MRAVRTILQTILLALSFACASLRDGATIHAAPPTGDPARDRTALVAAFADAQPGDTIRFAAGTYEVGPIVRVATPGLTVLGHPDGTTLRGGEIDLGAGHAQFGDDRGAADRRGVLHLFEGDCTVRGLTFTDSWWGLVLGWHYGLDHDDREPARQGGFVVESNTFQRSQNGVRATNAGSTPTVIRGNRFVDVHYGVSVLGNAFVVEDNTFTMTELPRDQGHGDAVRVAGEHVAGSCSDNRVARNTMSGQDLGVGMYTDGSRAGTGNQVRGNRITVRRGADPSVGVDLRVRADPDRDERPTGGLFGTVVADNHIAGAATAGISVGVGCDDTRVVANTFADLGGPAIRIEARRTQVTGHEPGIEVLRVEGDAPGATASARLPDGDERRSVDANGIPLARCEESASRHTKRPAWRPPMATSGPRAGRGEHRLRADATDLLP